MGLNLDVLCQLQSKWILSERRVERQRNEVTELRDVQPTIHSKHSPSKFSLIPSPHQLLG